MTTQFDLVNAARRVIESALGVVRGERVAIIADVARQDLGVALADAARTVGAEAEVALLDRLGTRPLRVMPAALRAVLERAQASVLLVSFEEGEFAMRGEIIALVAELRLRHGHMVGVGRRGMLAGFSADQARIVDMTRAVRRRLRPDSLLRLRSTSGSELEVRLDPTCRWQERIGIVRTGGWENLPSGELFTCPADVNGVFVADGSLGGPIGAAAGGLARTPLRVEVKSGVCRSIRCTDRTIARQVEELFRSEPRGDRVGMVMLGTNVGMHEATGEMVCDQNLPGLHLGFGATFPAQTGASWNAATQLSMTCVNGDVDLDGAPLLRSGRYVII